MTDSKLKENQSNNMDDDGIHQYIVTAISNLILDNDSNYNTTENEYEKEKEITYTKKDYFNEKKCSSKGKTLKNNRSSFGKTLNFIPKPISSDIYTPRKTNAQIIIFSEDYNKKLWVLLQLRSPKMDVMPSYIAAVGGRYDEIDLDSRYTAIRESKEETGIIDLNVENIEKFNQSKTCDWYVTKKTYPSTWDFEKASDQHEVWNVQPYLDILRPYGPPKDMNDKQWIEPFGHLWIQIDHVNKCIKKWQNLYGSMYGLNNRIFQAKKFMQKKNI